MQRIKPTEATYDLEVAMPFGEMPDEALVKKFEETEYMNDSEDVYENYARGTLRDNGPEPRTLASDEVRRNYNSKGFLNLIHSGGRGEYNSPAHPEAFLALTEREPRGVATDPDMRKLAEQEEARMRFVRFGPDADNSIHEGVWSKSQEFYKTRYLTQKAIQPRAKIFTTSKDGRREGMRREYYPHESYVNRVEEDTTCFRPSSKTFTDYITNSALTPQRQTVKLSNKLIRNTRWYHHFATDHEFKVAKYGQGNRRQRRAPGERSRQYDIDADVANKCGEGEPAEDAALPFKAAAFLMGSIVRMEADSDQTGGKTLDTQAGRKTAELKKDLNEIMYHINMDSAMKKSDNSIAMKTAKPQMAEHAIRVTAGDHLTPAHHWLNAELMYKAVVPGADTEAVKYEIIRDGKTPHTLLEDETRSGKHGPRLANPMVARETNMSVDGKSLKTPSFKHLARSVKGAVPSNSEPFGANHRDSRVFKSGNHNYRETMATDIDPDTERQFNNNTQKERLIGSMSTDKFGVSRYAKTQHNMNDIAEMS